MVNLAVDDRKSDYDKINNVFYSHLLRGLLFPKDKESKRERVVLEFVKVIYILLSF